MNKTIDLSDLPPDKIKMVEEFVEFLKKSKKERKKTDKRQIAFASWPLAVRGRLTREEIYEQL